MREIHAYPPNFAAINAEFRVAGKPVFFCYGDTVFNPSKAVISPELMAHEETHSIRQGDDPAGWWERYINDKAFRLEEETAAHITEYRYIMEYDSRRNSRRVALKRIAARLSSDLYGGLIRYDDAVKLLKQGLN